MALVSLAKSQKPTANSHPMSEHLYIDSARVDAESLEPFSRGLAPERREVLAPLLTFLREWWSEEEGVTVQTSGSTGTPKRLQLAKLAMRRSGLRSNRYFQIQAGKRLLLAMDLRYIGAKMMVVRALLAGAELIVVQPSSHPLATLSVAPQFVSLVPLQLHHTLEVLAERELLSRAEQLIIGGGAIHPTVEAQLSALPVAAFATYGMTETISHVALRRLNGPHASPLFYPLEGVHLTQGAEGELIIEDRLLYPEGPSLTTHDLVKLHPDGGFTIVGRADNIINSGGIKISPEPIERKLAKVLDRPLAISWIADAALGQKLVLVLEGDSLSEGFAETLTEACQQLLPPYHRPKEIRLVSHLPHNDNGKLDRLALQRLLLSLTSYEANSKARQS